MMTVADRIKITAQIAILKEIAIDLGGSMMAHSLYVKVNFWYRLMFWACFTFLLYKAGLFDVLMK